MPVILFGAVASCGALLVLAGAGKARAGARRTDGDDAIRRALRVPRPWWHLTEIAVGCAELATGGVVCAGAYPVAGGVAMATLGTGFCAVLGYARLRGIPGGCGCLGWRWARQPGVTWRPIARAGLVGGAGIAQAAWPRAADAFTRPMCYAGVAAGAALLVLLSAGGPARGGRCRRPLWRPVASTARDLAGSSAFQAMAAAAGPFEALAAHQRDGCVDEYWLTAAGDPRRAVIFRVTRLGDAPLAVHAALAGPGVTAPARPVRVPRPRDRMRTNQRAPMRVIEQ